MYRDSSEAQPVLVAWRVAVVKALTPGLRLKSGEA